MYPTSAKFRSNSTSSSGRRRSYGSGTTANRTTKSSDEGDFDDMGRNATAWSYWGMRKKKRGQF